MMVSIIIPARNAAATIAETLDSVLAQTFQSWEAIVVDDGSDDDTCSVVDRYAVDPRIKIIKQSKGGASAARNAGIERASYEWLLFLDADDWILPKHLELMTGALERNRDATAAYCGWGRKAPDGTLTVPNLFTGTGDLFSELVGSDLFPIHAVLLQKKIVLEVGGWQPSLITCEDWDLWQRVARTGARFIRVPEVLALYRMRPGSASLNVQRMLKDGLEVIRRGHGTDPRVSDSAKHASGAQDGLLNYRLALHVFWCACYAIGQGIDPCSYLTELPPASGRWPEFSALADALFEGIPIGRSCAVSQWPTLWREYESAIQRLLIEVEIQSGIRGYAEQTRRRLLQLIVRASTDKATVFGDMLAIRVAANQIPEQVPVPPGVVGLVCLVESGGRPLGSVHSVPDADGVCRLRSQIRKSIARWIQWRLVHRRRIELEPMDRWVPVQSATTRERTRLALGIVRLYASLFVTAAISRISSMVFRRDVNTGLAPNFFEYLFAMKPDPWQYDNEYEKTKYERSLSLLPDRKFNSALEIGCAEGRFTLALAQRASAVTAVDASPTALARAVQRCSAAAVSNISFQQLDAFRTLPNEQYEIVICSEILYYLGSVQRLQKFAKKLQHSIAPGGYLLTAHAYTSTDDSRKTGFEWETFGAETISNVLQAQSELRLRSEYSTSLYRIQLYQRSSVNSPATRVAERIIGPIPPAEQTIHLKWHEPETPAPPSLQPRTRIPILMYHRVAPTGSRQLAEYRVTPSSFESQLKYLAEHGFKSLTLAQWYAARESRTPLPGRSVVLTFDDGYLDFEEFAWPLLKKYGFSASVFLVTGLVGGANTWDSDSGESVPLMTWKSAKRLAGEGADFGSHTVTHPSLCQIDLASAREQALNSREHIKEHLGFVPKSFAYPFGYYNWSVRQLIKDAGYQVAVSCNPMAATYDSDLISLPRFQISGTDTVKDFALKLW